MENPKRNHSLEIFSNVVSQMTLDKKFTEYDLYNALLKMVKTNICDIRFEDGYNLLQLIIIHERTNLLACILNLNLWSAMAAFKVVNTQSEYYGLTAHEIAKKKKKKVLRDYTRHENLAKSSSVFMELCSMENNRLVEDMITKNFSIVNDKDSMGNNCLYYAVISDKLEIFELLVKRGANVKKLNEKKQSLLHAACIWGKTKFIEILIVKYQLDALALCNEKKTPADRIAENGDIDSFKQLLKCGITVTPSNVICAASCGRLPFLRFVFEQKTHFVDIDCRDTVGKSPLMKSCEKGHFDVVTFLIAKGANVNTTDQRRRNALHFAATSGDMKIIELLLQNGAKVNDQDFFTGADLCFLIKGKDRSRQAWHYLEVKRNIVHKFMKEIRTSYNVDIAKYGVCIKSGWGEEPNADQVQYIENLFAARSNDVNAQSDVSPLHLAIYKIHPSVAQVLIENGANVHMKDKFGMQPIHYCALKNDIKTAAILEKHGVNFDVQDNEGKTPLDIAKMNENTEFINFIEGKKTKEIAETFINESIARLLQTVSTEQLEQYRQEGKDVRRYNIAALRDIAIEINCALKKLGSGPVTHASSDTNTSSGSASQHTEIEHFPGITISNQQMLTAVQNTNVRHLQSASNEECGELVSQSQSSTSSSCSSSNTSSGSCSSGDSGYSSDGRSTSSTSSLASISSGARSRHSSSASSLSDSLDSGYSSVDSSSSSSRSLSLSSRETNHSRNLPNIQEDSPPQSSDYISKMA